ncbi:MAG: UbiA-like polyprenyltransferase [Desulfohalobiaceae bacterium]
MQDALSLRGCLDQGVFALKVFARMVKLEHSVFALPFALIGFFLAASGHMAWAKLVLLVIAMVAIRTWAMAMNRILDRDLDAQNPRTQDRPLVTGEISLRQAWILSLATALVFVLACLGLNLLCFVLAWPVLLWSALYSLSKRLTWLAHFWLGSVLGLAPVAGWLAYEPVFTLPAVLFGLGVLFWVAGFDILYSCQDMEVDQKLGLGSAPVRLGLQQALFLSALCHVNTVLFFLLAGWASGLGWLYFSVWLIISIILLWEHGLVSPGDLSRLNTAFFSLNGLVAVLLFLGVILDPRLGIWGS